MQIGRPRTTTPNDEELIELGEELLTWATEKTKELRYHLNQWYCLEKGYTKKQWDLMCDKEAFRAYYERARIAIAKRYVDGSINSTIACRFLRLYFPELRDEENATKKYEADLRKLDPEQAKELLIQITNYAKSKDSDTPA